MTSPTFVARSADDTETRMTIYHAPERKTFDLKRSVALSRAACASRKRGNATPAIVEARFEESEVVLEKYDARQLAEATSWLHRH
jgi:hypothetical protein